MAMPRRVLLARSTSFELGTSEAHRAGERVRAELN